MPFIKKYKRKIACQSWALLYREQERMTADFMTEKRKKNVAYVSLKILGGKNISHMHSVCRST